VGVPFIGLDEKREYSEFYSKSITNLPGAPEIALMKEFIKFRLDNKGVVL
jgi:hypothetical protein